MRLALIGVAAFCALLPVAAIAAPTPEPDTLKAALAEPPSSDWVEADSTVKGEGPMDAQTYASIETSDTSRQQQLVHGLDVSGFVSGYGRVWAKKAAGVALVEQILVFTDDRGALSYEGSSKLADTSSTSFVGAIDTSSVPSSYGAKELSGGYKTAAVAFVKGNDLVLVALVSGQDYLVDDTMAQAQAAYAHAPDHTIQPADQTPALASSPAYQLGRFFGFALVAVVVIGVIVVAVGLIMRRRRLPAVAALPFTLSSDGRFWWDGVSWQDSAVAAPPSAQRTGDGAYWWDGRSWRPVPRQATSGPTS